MKTLFVFKHFDEKYEVESRIAHALFLSNFETLGKLISLNFSFIIYKIRFVIPLLKITFIRVK